MNSNSQQAVDQAVAQRDEEALQKKPQMVQQNQTTEPNTQQRRLCIGDFTQLQNLGDGAFGRVVSAHKNNNPNKVYAIKIIDKKKMMLEKKEHHVFIEKEVLKYLDHPGIIKLEYSFHDKYHLYFALEKAEDTLTDHMRIYGSQVNFAVIQYYAAMILSILEFIHNKGIVHRDVKPDNLLLTKERRLKLIDFGTSIVFDQRLMPPDNYARIQKAREEHEKRKPQEERRTSFVGTKYYLSPEMLNDQQCGPTSDLWAFGCIVYFLFTGTTPFNKQDEVQLFKDIREADLIFPEKVPPKARDLLKQIMCKDCRNRVADYNVLRSHQFFEGIDFEHLWENRAPQMTRAPKRSKTFVDGIPIDLIKQTQKQPEQVQPENRIIIYEKLEKDSGIIISYFSPRNLVLEIKEAVPNLYYTNPKLNDKKTTIPFKGISKCRLVNDSKFVITSEGTNYIFKTKQAMIWVKHIQQLLQSYSPSILQKAQSSKQ